MLTRIRRPPPIKSQRPVKQLMWLWLAKDMRESTGFRDGLDLACGDMSVKRLFRTDTYTGLDIDQERLELAGAKHPDANAVWGDIESCKLTGDFVVCLQTIGFNRLFNHDRTLPTVRKLIACTRPDGTLIVNLGRQQNLADQVDDVLRDAFATVQRRTYGRFVEPRGYRVSMMLAQTMNALTFLRGSGWNYFVCKGRQR